jgi:hypothetical protein
VDDKWVSYDFAGNPYIRGVTEYKVYRAEDGPEPVFEEVGAVSYGITSYVDDLRGSAAYYMYRVAAYDGTYEVESDDVSRDVFAADDEKAVEGDFDSGGFVDLNDFFMFAGSYGSSEGDAAYYAVFDIAAEFGTIDVNDFFAFAAKFGTSTGSIAKAVPTRMGANLETILAMSVLRDEAQEFMVRVTLDKATDLAGYGFTVRYDASVFEFDRAVVTDLNILTSNGALTAPLLVVSKRPGELVLANAIRSGETVVGEGLAADLSFKVKDEMGGNVRVTSAMATDAYHRTNPVGLRLASVAAKPKIFALRQNYPNPFNPVTTIEYALPEAASVRLEVFNTLGQVVATLADEKQEAGRYSVRWDGLNRHGEVMGSGVYFYHMVAGDFQAIKRMLLIK